MRAGTLGAFLGVLMMAIGGSAGEVRANGSQGPANRSDLPVVEWDAVNNSYIGRQIIVCGPVAHASKPGDNPATEALSRTVAGVMLGAKRAASQQAAMALDRKFTIVIPNYYAGFAPSNHYGGKRACAAGTVVVAAVGGLEMILTHPQQIKVESDGLPTLPRGDVAALPAGAISYRNVDAHIGETQTVCGVVLSVSANMSRAYEAGFPLPPLARAQLHPTYKPTNDTRNMHELHVGDRVLFPVYVLASGAGVPTDPIGAYTGRGACFSGRLEPSIFGHARMVIEDASKISIVE